MLIGWVQGEGFLVDDSRTARCGQYTQFSRLCTRTLYSMIIDSLSELSSASQAGEDVFEDDNSKFPAHHPSHSYGGESTRKSQVPFSLIIV